MISGPGLMGCGGDGGGGVISGDLISRKLVVPLVGAVVGKQLLGGGNGLFFSSIIKSSRALAGIAAGRRFNTHLSYTLFHS